MSVTLLFSCGGCNAKAEGTRPLRKEFYGSHGSWGFGHAKWKESPEDVAPDGWIAADPVTYATYCPSCWKEIEEGDGNG